MMIPKQVGGRLWSAGIVKSVFIMLLLLATPVGLHHQFTDPGIDEGLKFVHAFLTFGVFFPVGSGLPWLHLWHMIYRATPLLLKVSENSSTDIKS